MKGQLLQKHPRPRTLAATTPRVDVLVERQIPQNLKDLRRIDGQLFEAQSLLLDAAGPFTALWDEVQAELETKRCAPSELVVPANRLLTCVVAGMRLLGAANHRISAMRRERFLAELDKGLTDMASETFPQAGENLFGDELVERIAGRVESQKALSTVLGQLRQQQPRKRPRSPSGSGTGDSRRKQTNSGPPRTGDGRQQFFRRTEGSRYGTVLRGDQSPYFRGTKVRSDRGFDQSRARSSANFSRSCRGRGNGAPQGQ